MTDTLEIRMKRAIERIQKVLEEEEIGMMPVMNPEIQFVDQHKPAIITAESMKNVKQHTTV